MSAIFACPAWQSAEARAFGNHLLQIVADTSNGQWLSYGALYAQTLGEIPDNPYVRYLGAKPARRAKIKYVLLEAMEGFPGMERRKDAEHQSAQVWFRQGQLTISRNRVRVGSLFNHWRQAMLETSVRERRLWRLPAERIVLRNQQEPGSSSLGRRVALGVDPQGRDWAVQINEAERPGDANITSAIAHDGRGRPYLLHQGRLNGNRQSGPILDREFEQRTGLKPITVANGDTKIARSWHLVTPLDVDREEIRRRTADFVHHCVLARAADPPNSTDREVLDELYARDERGGTYELGRQLARDARLISRRQGEVWQALARLLRARGIMVRKPRHAAGYEVDAEIVNGRRRLLAEIKSGAAAREVYAGVGQLLLYRRLLPSLAEHVPVLLLPHMPRPALAKAVEQYGVVLCTFQFTETADTLEIRFEDKLLKLCGAAKPKS